MDFLYGGFMFLFVIGGLSVVLAILGLVLGKKVVLNREKLTSFECGFDPMESSRNTFSLRFFLLAIVFLIFDVELVLFLPYILSLSSGVSMFLKLSMGFFVVILVAGLIHEFNEGSLDWNN